jgi:hypothetical protein
MAETFLEKTPENGDHNQYWYSKHTINCIVEDQVAQDAKPNAPAGGRISAYLSTPSIYFPLPESMRERCYVFDVGELQLLIKFARLHIVPAFSSNV